MEDPRLLLTVSRKIRVLTRDNPDSHFCIQGPEGKIFIVIAQTNLFVQMHSREECHEPMPIAYYTKESNLNSPFWISELTDTIHSTKVTTWVEDGISEKLFKGLSSHSLNVLLQVYNSLWEAAVVLPDWSSAVILPIIKPGKSKKTTFSYWPIAFTFVVCKIFERMISCHIINQPLT